MRKVILQEFVSLDGLAAGQNDSVTFIPASVSNDQTFGREQLALIDAIDLILLGRVTYQMFAAHWPNVTEGEDKVFAEKLNAIPKTVFSKTLRHAPWGQFDAAKIVKHDAAGEVAALKRQPGKNMILWGSISVSQSLIGQGLIDECRLVFCPVVLGSGRPLFGDHMDALGMTLSSAQPLDRGAVQLTYVPENAR